MLDEVNEMLVRVEAGSGAPGAMAYRCFGTACSGGKGEGCGLIWRRVLLPRCILWLRDKQIFLKGDQDNKNSSQTPVSPKVCAALCD
ncbi:hypothetical protein [Cupriavidus pauculus]|uniref:hypothetical protein n=1 Tax=Cupriavidus pauculus TaxID=82633 RepID=UPI001FD13CB3|nr:hypothetical protein [Cupriavidus pauculus]